MFSNFFFLTVMPFVRYYGRIQ